VASLEWFGGKETSGKQAEIVYFIVNVPWKKKQGHL
jgi:hypothetical protein